MNTISHYCQKCRHANIVGERTCRRCGTRLMLVVFPPSIRHDESIVPSFYEDHLLERVSLLELKLAQIAEKIGMAYEFFARESKELQKDHKFIRAFSEALREINPQLADELNRRQAGILRDKAAGKSPEKKEKRVLETLLAQHDKPNAELFTRLVGEGVRLLEQKEEKQAFQMLERAALLSPENLPLLTFTAEQLYRADKFPESKKYLETAFALEPNNGKILLMLGAVSADQGKADDARRFLSVPANNEKTDAAVNFVWAMLAAYEENWAEALAAFKLASEKTGAPELDFLIGCVYFQLENYRAALESFDKVLLKDEKFADARLMQNVIFSIETEVAGDDAVERKKSKISKNNFSKSDLPDLKKHLDSENVLPFAHFRQTKKHLLTGGTPRLNRLFRQLMFKAIEEIL